jgi:hypothetical protein
MKFLDKNKVKIKNLIGIIENPTYEDLLFEIVLFLNDDANKEGNFKIKDVYFRTKTRLSSDIREDVAGLVERGYVERIKYSEYKVIKHLWEED